MSHVTTLLINVSISEPKESVDALADYFSDKYGIREITECRDGWGGGKVPQATMFAGAYNYFDTEALLDFIKTIPWVYPEDVQVFAQEEYDSKFTLYEPFAEGEQ